MSRLRTSRPSPRDADGHPTASPWAGSRTAQWRATVPGLALCAAAVSAALMIHRLVPSVSALLMAILLGVALANTGALSPVVQPGLAVAAKRLLRIGVVLLGLQVVLAEILHLGIGMIAVVVAIVAGGIGLTMVVGRRLGLSFSQRLLIACGFSICGAAAVAAVDGVADAEEEEVVTAVALVVVFGTLMIPLVPVTAGALGLSDHAGGAWAGGAVHEVAQVVAAGGTLGGAALGVAVVVKLTRVLMLAPVIGLVSWRQRRQTARTEQAGVRPPLVPVFVAGFIAMVVMRSTGLVPPAVLDTVQVAETALLSAAMFALGCGVRVRALLRVGPRPFVLGAISTVAVAGISLGGVLLVG
jgi:uncharacterized integral membrane protein (TIGR00698 family)